MSCLLTVGSDFNVIVCYYVIAFVRLWPSSTQEVTMPWATVWISPLRYSDQSLIPFDSWTEFSTALPAPSFLNGLLPRQVYTRFSTYIKKSACLHLRRFIPLNLLGYSHPIQHVYTWFRICISHSAGFQHVYTRFGVYITDLACLHLILNLV